jgi:hypothetical protein
MFLVAIAELRGSLDAAVSPLAADLNTTPYELRLLLNAGFPAVVLSTIDEGLARSALLAIETRGHTAVSCDRRSVSMSHGMTRPSSFTFTATALTSDENGSELLPFDDLGAILRATQRETTETTEEIKERKLRPVMAVATGGLVMSKNTTREVVKRAETREQVLYLFRRSGAPPWLLRERGTRYGGLGKDLGPTSFANFQTTIKKLRERAPGAAYDERLMNGRPIRGVTVGADATDLLAHLLATHLMSVRSRLPP